MTIYNENLSLNIKKIIGNICKGFYNQMKNVQNVMH